eukprot:jgi/Chlat1/7505/Chrsp61S07005
MESAGPHVVLLLISSSLSCWGFFSQVHGHDTTTGAFTLGFILGGGTISTPSSALSLSSLPPPTHGRTIIDDSATADITDPALAHALEKYASDGREIMLALADGVMLCRNATLCWWNGGNILATWVEEVKRVGVGNYVVAVLDDETERYCKQEGVNYFRAKVEIPASQKGTHPANRVSTVKYSLLTQMLQLGYSVLLVDMDLVFFKNPFEYLHRDADVEVQTDGFDGVAYGAVDGITDKTMGWGGGGLFIKTFTVNVGCMFVRPTAPALSLVQRVAKRLSERPAWDQQVFNEILMFPSHGEYASPGASLRVLDYMLFMNSKIYFRTLRGRFLPAATAPETQPPVMVHMNYHPDKHKRMLCLIDRYVHGKVDACDNFPGGSEPGTR